MPSSTVGAEKLVPMVLQALLLVGEPGSGMDVVQYG